MRVPGKLPRDSEAKQESTGRVHVINSPTTQRTEDFRKYERGYNRYFRWFVLSYFRTFVKKRKKKYENTVRVHVYV
jgi:hypothetical protein